MHPYRLPLLTYRGSIAHGMHLPAEENGGFDDIDLIGAYIPSPEDLFGTRPFAGKLTGTVEIKEGSYDIVLYDLRKFIKLLAQGNPNVIAVLWTDRKHHVYVNRLGAHLYERREMFLSKRIYHAFIGYAWDQLKRMTSPQKYDGFMGEKRKALVDQFGYDTKNAAHTIRLLRMACEFFETGAFNVDRSTIDAADLLSIKQGGWVIEAVQSEAEHLFSRAVIAVEKSTLPEDVDMAEVNKFCMELVGGYYGVH
jgi:predicted nucleotidyltransferase